MMRRKWMLAVAGAVSLAHLSCINPTLTNSVNGGIYPLAPGDTPFLLVQVVNNSTATLSVPIQVDDGAITTYRLEDIPPLGRESGILLRWPVLRFAVGSISNPFDATAGIKAVFPSGLQTGVPFNMAALQAGVSYFQGDTVIVNVQADQRNTSVLTVSVARIDGMTQQGPFTGADTFETTQLVLDLFDPVKVLNDATAGN